jgi:hypothetical protein
LVSDGEQEGIVCERVYFDAGTMLGQLDPDITPSS